MLLTKNAKTYFYLGLLLLLIIILFNTGLLNWLKNLSHRIVLKTIFTSEQTETNSDKNACTTSTDNEILYISKIQMLESENEELRNLLGFKPKINAKTIGAMIVGKNFDAFERTVIIDRGTKDGIKTGHAVIAKNGVMIGKITRADENISVVRLLSDSGSRVGAMILNKDRSAGVVEGGYGLSVKMSFIPRNENIMIDELVITSGLEPDIPQGLLMGKIAIVENEAYKPFQQATISPGVNADKISAVFVVTPN